MSFFYKSYTAIQHELQDIYKQNQCKAQAMKKIVCMFKQLIVNGKAFCGKRALRFAPLSALMTVEAALVLPFFLIAVLTLLNLVHTIGVQQELLATAAVSVHEASVHGYAENFGTDDVLGGLVLDIGWSDVDFSHISGGMAGIDYWGTGYDGSTGEIDVRLSCAVKPVFGLFDTGNVKVSLSLRGRAFIGGKLLNDSPGQGENEGTIVYVAQNGVVYHRSRECAYIDLSLHGVGSSAVDSLRNSQGGKYYPCELCGDAGGSAVVYLTDTGNRYHCSSQCSGISRTVYEMVLTSDCVLPPCSRCGG